MPCRFMVLPAQKDSSNKLLLETSTNFFDSLGVSQLIHTHVPNVLSNEAFFGPGDPTELWATQAMRDMLIVPFNMTVNISTPVRDSKLLEMGLDDITIDIYIYIFTIINTPVILEFHPIPKRSKTSPVSLVPSLGEIIPKTFPYSTMATGTCEKIFRELTDCGKKCEHQLGVVLPDPNKNIWGGGKFQWLHRFFSPSHWLIGLQKGVSSCYSS